MQIAIDGTALELNSSAGMLSVNIPKHGYDQASLDVIRSYVDARETETGLTIDYPLASAEVSFRTAVGLAETRLDRLSLAQRLVAAATSLGGLRVPVIHPDNVYLSGDLLRVVHNGIAGMLAPRTFDEELFFQSVQTMVLNVFRPKMPFEQLYDGAKTLKDKFSTQVCQVDTIEELVVFLDAEYQKERAETLASKVTVSKRSYGWFRAVGILGLVTGLVAGVFGWWTSGENRAQAAVIAAQSSFLANDYGGTLTKLEDYPASSLPSSAKYVLAVSSINLGSLTQLQKQAILNNISEKTDDVTLNYWIAVGRGEFDQALDYAKNLGDDQLTLLAYTDLYQATTLNTSMPGDKKQDLLAEYAKAIDELTKQLSGEDVANETTSAAAKE